MKKKSVPKYKVNTLDSFTKKYAYAGKKQDELLNARSRSKSSESKKSDSLKKFSRLKRKNSEDSEQYVQKEREKSQESQEDIKNQRFFVGDIDDIQAQIKQKQAEQKRKKSKNRAIDQMIKNEKKNPKPQIKKNQKMTSEQKEQLHKKALQESKKSKEQVRKEEVMDDDRSLDSEEERIIRIRKIEAREHEDDQIKKAIRQSMREQEIRKKEQQDLERAIKESLKIQSSASKVTQIQSPQKNDDQDTDLIEMYERKKKEEQKKKEEKRKKAESKKKAEASIKENTIYGPLTKKTFVLTGVFPEGKDRIADMLKSLGAAVRGSVSKKTDYVLQGTILQDGREVDTSAKSRDAMNLGVKIVKYQDLDSVMVKLTNKTIAQNLQNKPLDKIMKTEVKPEKMDVQQLRDVNDSRLWVDKYKPKTLQQIIGQNSQVQNLIKWLRTWDDVHVKGIKHEVKQFYNKNQAFQSGGTINSKAALISGDPGIGKTTAARMICRLLGYDYVEFNASDIRNKNNILGLQWNSLTLTGQLKQSKRVMIMDEVDGMSGGDRGGIQAIIKMIKEAKAPVICICNDRQHDKIRSLANHCYDIKFFKPNKALVTKRVMSILSQEGIPAEQQCVLHIVETFNSDMRQILNYLNMSSRTKSKLTFLDTKESLIKSKKDTLNNLNKWTASTKLLNRVEFSKMRIYERLQLFFSQTDMIPLMIEDSLCGSMHKKPNYPLEDIQNLAAAYDSIARSDVVNKQVWSGQQWALMPFLGFLSCVYPPQKVSNSIGFPKFPEWFGKNSTSRKIIRQVRQLKWALCGVATGNSKAIQYDYAPALMQSIIRGLQDEDIEGVLTFLEEYNIRPDMIKQHLQDIIYNPEKTVFFDAIPSQIKSKLTRAYNKRHEEILKEKRVKQTGGEAHAQKYNDILDEMEVEVEDEPQADNNEPQDNIVKNNAKVKTKSKK